MSFETTQAPQESDRAVDIDELASRHRATEDASTSNQDSDNQAKVNIEEIPPTPDERPGRPSLQSSYSSYSLLPETPGVLSRSPSWSGTIVSDGEEYDVPPLERLTVFDFLENLALPQRLEQLQLKLASRTEKVRRGQQKLRSSSKAARERVVDEWRKRIPTPDEQYERYRRRMRDSVDKFGKRWNDAKTVTVREKVSFMAGVLNLFIAGYVIGAFPEWFHILYTVELAYFFPIRFYTYRKRGYHYFLADLCYFVNFLLLLSIWAFPSSKRLFISAFCLAFGNNAVAIPLWRNSLVFHSLDKTLSTFIHIMPCVTIHIMVHLIPESLQESRFPAIHHIKTSKAGSPEHYSLPFMVIWATIPYAVWQLSYHIFITVRRREKIAAGRPTSFTWLRKSFANVWIGRLVLSLPEALQEPAFMLIQYIYALATMAPAPLWFKYRWASAAFLFTMFTWSVYNGATYYIDVFGTRFQKELEKLKADISRMGASPEIFAKTPSQTPLQTPRPGTAHGELGDLSLGAPAKGEDTARAVKEALYGGQMDALADAAVDGPEGLRQRRPGLAGQ